jgi:putative peptidoglycan lipid II flippase
MLMEPLFAANILVQLVALGFLVGFGMALYFALVHVTRVQPLGVLLKRLRRRPA